MNSQNKYQEIISHYEGCLAKYGDSYKGLDWPNKKDALTRYKVMMEVIKQPTVCASNIQLLDFGCGLSYLLDHVNKSEIKNIEYIGLDMSSDFINACKIKHPNIPYVCIDALKQPNLIPVNDYTIMNGVFTEKVTLSFNEMFAYFCKLLKCIFSKVRVGIAFNVMSKAVDWERDDLFHLPTDLLINFLVKNLTRNLIIRSDYGLYEYTVYLYK